MSNLDHSPKEIVLCETEVPELTDKDRQFITRFNLQEDDLRFKSLAHEGSEATV